MVCFAAGASGVAGEQSSRTVIESHNPPNNLIEWFFISLYRKTFGYSRTVSQIT